jgi:hypothetical protein
MLDQAIQAAMTDRDLSERKPRTASADGPSANMTGLAGLAPWLSTQFILAVQVYRKHEPDHLGLCGNCRQVDCKARHHAAKIIRAAGGIPSGYDSPVGLAESPAAVIGRTSPG